MTSGPEISDPIVPQAPVARSPKRVHDDEDGCFSCRPFPSLLVDPVALLERRGMIEEWFLLMVRVGVIQLLLERILLELLRPCLPIEDRSL